MPKKYKYTKTFIFEGQRYYARGNTLEEVVVNREKKKAELKARSKLVSGDMTLSEWAARCIPAYKTKQKDVTRENFKYLVNHYILKHIGMLPLKSITPLNCQDTLNELEGLSQYVINQVYIAMNFLFSHAVDNRLILENPAANITKGKGSKKERRALNAYEEKIFLSACEKDERFLLFLLMYYCGCRPSEACNVMGMDIQEVQGKHLLHIRGTKTVKADRFVPIPDAIYYKIKGTPKFRTIVVNNAGNKIDSSSYKRMWKSLRREMNMLMGCRVYRNELIPPFPLASDIVPYCLRHTYCTNLQKRGIDIRVAQYLMGHADIKMTANIYTHNDMLTAVEAASKINVNVAPYVAPEAINVEK